MEKDGKSRNSTDTQALVQSMLQRLKLQPGREGQVYLHAPVTGVAPGDEERGEATSSPVNGTNGLSSKEFKVKIQPPGPVSEVDPGLVSFPHQKENSDSGSDGKGVLGKDTQAGAGQLFPAKSLQDADISFSGNTEKDAVSIGQSLDKGQPFTNRAYVWSLNPTDGNIDTAGSQEEDVGNGGFTGKDLQIMPTNSSWRRKQWQSESKTRRWTQKIKERWRDRQGSFGKKVKEERQEDKQRSEQGTGNLPQNQLMPEETPIGTSEKAESSSTSSLTTSESRDTTLTSTEDGVTEGSMRSAGDFVFGLGSFSLLDEIVTGQEWAKFLNPNLSTPSANQRALEEITIQSNQPNSGNKQWSSSGTDTETDLDVSMAPTSLDVSQPVSTMDSSGGKQEQHSHADQPEPMEHGNSQSTMKAGESKQQHRPVTFLRPADLLDNSALRSRVQLNRKRQHQSAEQRYERLQTNRLSDGEMTVTEGSPSPTRQAQPSYIQGLSPLPLSPSSAPPKGVLKHSISHDSECSMEVESKRRRVEENRRVRFSEEVQAIPPPELDLDSEEEEEEESVADEESVIDEEPAAMEEAAPARRTVLPAWILALRRKNTGRKHR